jgi:hypothetical protein
MPERLSTPFQLRLTSRAGKPSYPLPILDYGQTTCMEKDLARIKPRHPRAGGDPACSFFSAVATRSGARLRGGDEKRRISQPSPSGRGKDASLKHAAQLFALKQRLLICGAQIDRVSRKRAKDSR